MTLTILLLKLGYKMSLCKIAPEHFNDMSRARSTNASHIRDFDIEQLMVSREIEAYFERIYSIAFSVALLAMMIYIWSGGNNLRVMNCIVAMIFTSGTWAAIHHIRLQNTNSLVNTSRVPSIAVTEKVSHFRRWAKSSDWDFVIQAAMFGICLWFFSVSKFLLFEWISR